jgi:hypothetical protein
MLPFFPTKTFREPGAMPEHTAAYHPDLKVRD